MTSALSDFIQTYLGDVTGHHLQITTNNTNNASDNYLILSTNDDASCAEAIVLLQDFVNLGDEFCRDENAGGYLVVLQEQIELVLDYLINELICHYPNNLAYVLEINNEIKLGTNAVAILALVKYMRIFIDSPRIGEYYGLVEKLANGIVNMQQDNGSFVHILDGNTLKVIAENRVIYYDRDALFALIRLYKMTKDERWIKCVSCAFDYFISTGHNDVHGHWLSYCSNELKNYKSECKYFASL